MLVVCKYNQYKFQQNKEDNTHILNSFNMVLYNLQNAQWNI